MSCWGAKHFKAALRILMYLYHTRDKCIHIKPDKNDFVLSAFSDANWCDPRDGGDVVDDKYKPQYGFVVFVSGVPVAWTSRRMQSRARSVEDEALGRRARSQRHPWHRAHTISAR